MIIINLIIDKSRLCYKITTTKNIDKTYRILNYTRIKPRSRPPQKKIRIFYAPRFFSGQNRIKKKCANYASKYGISLAAVITDIHSSCRLTVTTKPSTLAQY